MATATATAISVIIAIPLLMCIAIDDVIVMAIAHVIAIDIVTAIGCITAIANAMGVVCVGKGEMREVRAPSRIRARCFFCTPPYTLANTYIWLYLCRSVAARPKEVSAPLPRGPAVPLRILKYLNLFI